MDWTEIDNSPAAIRAFLAAEGLAPKKRWGQNFMISPGARRSVLSRAGIQPGEAVWEIGPGLGALTTEIARLSGSVTLFEIDHGLIRVLRRRFGEAVRIVQGDAVSTLSQELSALDESPACVIGNLPYRSAAAIIGVLLESERVSRTCRRMVFTVQREMARRMVASPGEKDYSPFSVLCALSGTVRHSGDLSGGSFYPVPEVVSSLISVDPAERDNRIVRIASICARSLFASRRKTIRNNLPGLARTLSLSGETVREALQASGIDLSLRAETLRPEEFVELAQNLEQELPSSYSG